jgi:hypothetical protein
VGIFSSYAAARNYKPLGVEYPKNGVLWATMQHAQYYFNLQKHEEYILLIPDGLSLEIDSPFNTRIDLPAEEVVSCKVGIRGRCLTEFDHIDLRADQVPGTVSVRGHIERNGKVSGVQVDSERGSTPGLASFARQNLRTWQFEPSQREDDIQLVYSVERVERPLEHGISVRLNLPDRVDIEVGPLLTSH